MTIAEVVAKKREDPLFGYVLSGWRNEVGTRPPEYWWWVTALLALNNKELSDIPDGWWILRATPSWDLILISDEDLRLDFHVMEL